MNRVVFIVAMLLIVLSVALPQQIKSFGYIEDWYGMSDTDALTDYIFFYDQLGTGTGYTPRFPLATMKTYADALHAKGKGVWISLQNNNDANMSYYSTVISKGDAWIRSSISQMMTYLRAIGAQGVVTDEEGVAIPNPDTQHLQAQWDALYQALSDSLHSAGMKFSSYVEQSVRPPWNSPVAVKTHDYIFPNGYDFNSTIVWNGVHYGFVGMSCLRDPGSCSITSLHENDSTVDFGLLKVGYQPGQIVNGMPGYGRAYNMYTANPGFCSPMLSLKANYVYYDGFVKNYLTQSNVIKKWGPQGATTIYVKGDTSGLNGQSPWLVDFPDVNSVSARVKFVRDHGFAGIYIYGTDPSMDLKTPIPPGHTAHEFFTMIGQVLGTTITPPPDTIHTPPLPVHDSLYYLAVGQLRGIAIGIASVNKDSIWGAGQASVNVDSIVHATIVNTLSQIPDTLTTQEQTVTIPGQVVIVPKPKPW